MRVENESQDKFDIIIVAGQSNASGCGMGETSIPYELNERIKMLNSPFTAEFLKTSNSLLGCYNLLFNIQYTHNRKQINEQHDSVSKGKSNQVFTVQYVWNRFCP